MLLSFLPFPLDGRMALFPRQAVGLGPGQRWRRLGTLRDARTPRRTCGAWCRSVVPHLWFTSVGAAFPGEIEAQESGERARCPLLAAMAGGSMRHAQGRIDLARPWVDKPRVLANVVRAFPGLLPGQDFGKMMVREASQA